MKNVLFYISIIASLAAIILGSYKIGYSDGKKHGVEYKSDTVTVYRTKYVDSPIEKSSTSVGFISIPSYKFISEFVHDTTETTVVIHKTDTLYLPREQKYYEEMDGHARIWVSGYEPKLDRFEWDEPTVTVYRKPKRWNVSLSLGYGLTSNGPDYFVGITGGWSLFQF